MHTKGLMHRDLKPANILVTGDCMAGTCHAKVADLGLTCGYRSRIAPCQGAGGTPLYLAPETVTGRATNTKIDVWAMGLIFYELIFNSLPASLENVYSMQHLYQNIARFDITRDSKFRGLRDANLRSLFQGMLTVSATRRLSAGDALQKAASIAKNFDKSILASLQTSPATLPSCWSSQAAPYRVQGMVEPTSDEDETAQPVDEVGEDGGEIVMISFRPRMGDVRLNFFEKSLDWKSGCVSVDARAETYSHKDLFTGDKILEIAGVELESVTKKKWLLMKQGMYQKGDDRYLHVKLLRGGSDCQA